MFLVSLFNMSLQVIIRIFLYSICISGFWYQTINVSIDFFNYSVQTKIQQNVPNQVGVNNFAICARYADLILGKEYIDSRATVNGFLNNNTIADIFKKAPRKDTIIESCVVRNHDSFTQVAKDRYGCYEVFKVSRFISNEYVCYDVQYKNQSFEFDYLQVSRSFMFSHFFYRIVIDRESSLKDVIIMTASAYTPGYGLPYVSLAMSNTMYPKRSLNESFNYFITRFVTFKTNLLKPPYETNCYDYGNTSQNTCIMDCVKGEMISQFNILPSQVIIVEELLNVKQIDERNESMYEIVKDVRMKCESMKCPKKECSSAFTSSFTSKDMRSSTNDVAFFLGMASTPDTIIQSDPAMSSTQYVLYLMSLPGSWFGVSMIALNPTIYGIVSREEMLFLQLLHPMKFLHM